MPDSTIENDEIASIFRNRLEVELTTAFGTFSALKLINTQSANDAYVEFVEVVFDGFQNALIGKDAGDTFRTGKSRDFGARFSTKSSVAGEDSPKDGNRKGKPDIDVSNSDDALEFVTQMIKHSGQGLSVSQIQEILNESDFEVSAGYLSVILHRLKAGRRISRISRGIYGPWSGET